MQYNRTNISSSSLAQSLEEPGNGCHLLFSRPPARSRQTPLKALWATCFAVKASRWMIQWLLAAWGAKCLMRATTTQCFPVVAEAPSEVVVKNISQEIWFLPKFMLRHSKICSSVIWILTRIQNKTSCYVIFSSESATQSYISSCSSFNISEVSSKWTIPAALLQCS